LVGRYTVVLALFVSLVLLLNIAHAITTPTISLSNTFIDKGQSIFITASTSGGNVPYTYNYSIANAFSKNILANQLYISASTTNTFLFKPVFTFYGPADDGYWVDDYVTNALDANVVVTDSSHATANSIYTPIGYNSAPSLVIYPSNLVLDSGQYETYNVLESGGTGPFFNIEVLSSNGMREGSNSLITSVGGYNTISFEVTSQTQGNLLNYLVRAYDEGTTTPFNFNSTPIVNVIAIGTGTRPASIALSPSGNILYVTNYATGVISVVNVQSNTIINSITAGSPVSDIVFNELGTFAYAVNENEGDVNVINVATNSVVNTIGFTATALYGELFDQPSNILYVTEKNANAIGLINTTTNTIVNTISVGVDPIQVAINPSNSLIYVTNFNDNTTSVINTATNSVINTISLGTGTNPWGVTFNPSGTIAYVTDRGTNTISVIDVLTNSVTGSIKVGKSPVGVTLNPSGALLYVTNSNSNSITIINTTTNLIVANITSHTLFPFATVFNSNGTLAYVSLFGTGVVDVINPTYNDIHVNTAPTIPSITAAPTPKVTGGQQELFSTSFSGGTPPYTYNYVVINTITNVVKANMLLTNSLTSNSWILTVPSTWLGNTISANVIITDNASTPETFNSVNTPTITVTGSAPSTYNTLTLGLSNSFIDQGQGILFTANFITGPDPSPPYTYNYQILNSITGNTIANMLFGGNFYTSNSWFYLPPANLYLANTFMANIIVTDSHIANFGNVIINSVYVPFGYNSAPTIAITPNTSSISLGMPVTYNAQITGGTGPFTVNLLLSGTVVNTIIAASDGTFSFGSITPPFGSDSYNAIATDTGTTTKVVFNSTSNNILVSNAIVKGGGGGGSTTGGQVPSTSIPSTTIYTSTLPATTVSSVISTTMNTTTIPTTTITTTIIANSVGTTTQTASKMSYLCWLILIIILIIIAIIVYELIKRRKKKNRKSVNEKLNSL
jgi:YVTN family beta-propeller protein